jgi:hypothetical protein
MTDFLLKTKIDTSLERAFRDLHIHPIIGAVFSNGVKLISSVTGVMSWSSTSSKKFLM